MAKKKKKTKMDVIVTEPKAGDSEKVA